MISFKRFSYWILYFLSLGYSSNAAEEWKAFDFSWDKSPVDLSYLLDTPAGKHGFLDVKDGKFIFEDKTPARFWGTSISGAACFPAIEQAPFIAERLSCLGINLVRFEYMDAPWANPSLFRLSQKKTLELNPAALNQLDYFIFQLENRGIYIYLDGLDARVIQEGENIPYGDKFLPGFKGGIHFIKELRGLYQSAAGELWTHRNEYDQKEYRDNPSIVLFDLFSENVLRDIKSIPPYYAGELLNRWKDWCKYNKIKPIPPFPDVKEPALQKQFMTEITAKSCRDMISYFRSLNVKCPIGASNTIEDLSDHIVQDAVNYVSVHRPYPVPKGKIIPILEQKLVDWEFNLASNFFSETAFSHLTKKPFVWAKWGNPWPNPYRAELPLWTAAMACFQDWDGCVSTAYASISDPTVDYINSPLDSFNDPCFAGLFPASGLLFHQNDVPVAKNTVQMAIVDDENNTHELMTPEIARASRLVEFGKIDVIRKSKISGSLVFSPTMPEDIESVRKKIVKAPLFYRDATRGLVVINTPRSQAVIGNLKNSRKEDLKDVEMKSSEEFAVVCVSSLDREPIAKSRDLLITLISEARNTGFTAWTSMNSVIMEKPGQGPILIKNTPVKMVIHNNLTNWKLYGVSGNGENLDSIPFQIQDETVSFELGTQGTMYYRLQTAKKK